MFKISSVLILSTLAGLAYASEPKETVAAFHAALASGDKDKAIALIAPDITIYESGFVERSRDEYAGHHLVDDIKFSKVATRKVLQSTERRDGNMTVILEETETQANIKGKDMRLIGTETTVLQKIGDSWRIVHFHWSSRKPK
jgi:ketosteroid isomerase-like protein